MFLKSVTLRGFKSFADRTSLQFEPGITVVVGPNGSGKSNVVDAITWALGSHSPKNLRGGQMADVIFAGAPGRKGMGRAAVELTIDNTCGALPIDFSEVTVSRAMFATGESTYTINDTDCRLLDVVELLGDAGVGRAQHTIVGQGQLDAVLGARPTERRAFIEEAAGILKHRQRKERALRKLAQMDGHVERLEDLLRELTRNLRPLERQAEAARAHAELTAALREVRVLRALREFAVQQERVAVAARARAESDATLAAAEAALAAEQAAERTLQDRLQALAPTVRAAGEVHFRLANLVERYRGLAGRIEERRGGLVAAVEEPVAGRDPDELRSQAAQAARARDDAAARLVQARTALDAAVSGRGDAERARRAHEQAAAAEARRRAEARERRIRWEGEVQALRSAIAQGAAEEGRLASHLAGQTDRLEQLERDRAAVTAEIQRLDADTGALAQRRHAAADQVQRLQAARDAAARTERELERRRASLEARADTLLAASQEAGEGAVAVLSAADEGTLAGIRGRLADDLHVADGLAAAVAAALGPVGEALLADDPAAAHQALAFARAHDSGRVHILAADTAADPGPEESLAELGAQPLADAVDGPPAVVAAVRRALHGTYAVASLRDACFLAGRRPEQVFVTPEGDVVGAGGCAAGGEGHRGTVAARAAAEEAAAQARAVAAELLVAHRRVGDADRAYEAARAELDTAEAVLAESDSQITAAAERLGRLQHELERCAAQRAQLELHAEELQTQDRQRQERLTQLEQRGPEEPATDPSFDDGAGDVQAERLEDALAAAREHEVQARLAASATERERDELHRRVAALQAEADGVQRQLAQRERRRRERLAAIERCGLLAQVTRAALDRAERSAAAAAAQRDAAEEASAEQQRQLGVVRARVRSCDERLTALRDERHREDLTHQECGLAMQRVADRLAELGLDTAAAAAACTDDVTHGGAERDQELAEQESRLARKVGLLGTVNPLALKELAALQERHAFLTEQLADLRASKADLMEVVARVDERIREVFGNAFADVAEQFARIFPRLFPGGSGRLLLTDPDDLLECGVEVEARPPGKRVKRLSLLSGGERSLTALAVLFAIFAARPSPFYVLDEVEAALDDVNLQRLLGVMADFRGSSQLIVITHQRRTMEIADALYGVTMNRDGVSQVVSQRMRESAPA